MALFSFLVSKFGIPAVAFFAGMKALKAWKEQQLGKLAVIILVAGFIVFFLENPETVLNATKPIWSKLIEAVK